MARFLGGPVTFHETARRLFVGSVGAQFSAEIRKTMPPQLVLNFSSPVNPTISTEPGKLRMVFNREPLINAGTQTFTFPDKTIPFATYQENNGAAEITVSGTAPLMASFSGDRRTITILAAVSAAQAPAQVQPTAPASTPSNVPLFNAPPENPAPGTTNIPGGVPMAPAGRRFLAVVDASHGGDERGAALTGSLPEKDVTLAVARRLRQELENRGVGVLMLRDSDVTLEIDQRAAATNMAHPAVYIGLHASTQGNGVRLYTAVLPSGWEGRGSFLGWETAQSSALAVSQAAVTGVAVELQRKRVPVRSLAAPLRPLNNITVAAMAVEVAPPGTDVLEVASPNYEQLVASAIANGVAQLRDRQGFPQ